MIFSTSRQLTDLGYRCISQVETNGDERKWFSLYLAKSGNSGFSFSPIQFDISSNQIGRGILASCGISASEIKELSGYRFSDKKPIDDHLESLVEEINAVLGTPSSRQIIIAGSKKYIDNALFRISMLPQVPAKIGKHMVMFLLDYHIQFNISINGQLHEWMKARQFISVEDFMEFKKSMKWANKPEGMRDIKRRFKELKSFCQKEKIWPEEAYATDQPEWLFGK
jgi:hypothetical protein